PPPRARCARWDPGRRPGRCRTHQAAGRARPGARRRRGRRRFAGEAEIPFKEVGGVLEAALRDRSLPAKGEAEHDGDEGQGDGLLDYRGACRGAVPPGGGACEPECRSSCCPQEQPPLLERNSPLGSPAWATSTGKRLAGGGEDDADLPTGGTPPPNTVSALFCQTTDDDLPGGAWGGSPVAGRR